LIEMDKRTLTERDICTKFITPALRKAGWDEMRQIREEVSFTKGRIIVRGKLVTRGQPKRADYILYYKPNVPVALIEAKDNSHSVGDGMRQALDYAATLAIPFVFTSNGDGFVFHDRTGASSPREVNLALDGFPAPAALWARYRAWKGFTPEAEEIVLQDYYDGGSGKARAITRLTRSTPPSRPSPRAATASCSSWRPAPGRPTPPSRSFGGCGRPAARSASFFWPTATC
jgi:type I restriction enzyme R subunit